jgi:RAQPRD family integrative conjugative element protein
MRTFLFLSVGLLVANSVTADPEGEREALARVAHELDALAPMIAEAEAQADPDARLSKLSYYR